ncbi:MAG: hypothetical protein JO166_11120 [Deltaproteobacteria bacterium]|nr:hypothetical protein [Deltaproteobacteria bacterium]
MTESSKASIALAIPAPHPPYPAEPRWENFPSKLTIRPQWVLWAYLFRDGRWTKCPFQPDGSFASATDPATWAPFEFVQCAYFSLDDDDDARFDGVGFVVTATDPFTVFDFDHCRDPETGEIDPTIASYVHQLDSYTEVSPSGTGVRVVVEATLPPHHRRLGRVEMYNDRRFVSFTGHVL